MKYTLLKQDGIKVMLQEEGKEWDYKKMQHVLGGRIELIPRDYYPKGTKGEIYGHEEARYNENNKRNPFTLVLKDLIYDDEWDCVGDLLLVQK